MSSLGYPDGCISPRRRPPTGARRIRRRTCPRRRESEIPDVVNALGNAQSVDLEKGVRLKLINQEFISDAISKLLLGQATESGPKSFESTINRKKSVSTLHCKLAAISEKRLTCYYSTTSLLSWLFETLDLGQTKGNELQVRKRIAPGGRASSDQTRPTVAERIESV